MTSVPKNILYATSARIGGSGLDSVAQETLLGVWKAGALGKAIAYENRQDTVPGKYIRSLRAHPIRLLSFLDSQRYYGAKKQYLDWISARELDQGEYDLFHGWSGECLRTLRLARARKIPSVIEVPTWHRNKGLPKPRMTRQERDASMAGGVEGLLNRLLITRQQQIEEYELADLILCLSAKAEETFLSAGLPASKLFRHSRGVDPERFSPGVRPPIFRAVFAGALIKRKGVHHLLEVWHRLGLRNAELVLAGSVHDEIQPYLRDFAGDSVKLPGFVSRVEEIYRSASVHIFPSTCEGSAKATYEAAACGLPQISTRESGDVVLDGVNGIVIPCDDPDALAAAIQKLYANPDLCARMGDAGRERILQHFTWDHFRERLMDAYNRVLGRSRIPAAA